MSGLYFRPAMRRDLLAVYRFYDVFLLPVNDGTPAIAIPLNVSIPSLGLTAFRADSDLTYRFSAVTITQPVPSGVNLAVEVTCPTGEYVNFQPIVITLPPILSDPPLRSDFLVERTLWPTAALRTPTGETVVRGHIASPTSQPVAGLHVEMWPGSAPTPPAGTPFNLSNVNGDFLFRFPLLKGAADTVMTFGIRLNGGAIPVTPASLPVTLGGSRTISFQRT